MGFSIDTILKGFSDVNVNLKNTGSTLIFTQSDSTKLFFPHRIYVFSSNVSGAVTPPTLSIGTNSSTFNNILSTAAPALSVAGTYLVFNLTTAIAPITSGTQVFVNVTVGASATTYGARFAIFGDSV
jgi:hypothetical protein